MDNLFLVHESRAHDRCSLKPVIPSMANGFEPFLFALPGARSKTHPALNIRSGNGDSLNGPVACEKRYPPGEDQETKQEEAPIPLSGSCCTQRGNLFDFPTHSPCRVPQINGPLCVQPELGCVSKKACKAQRHLRADRPSLAQ